MIAVEVVFVNMAGGRITAKIVRPLVSANMARGKQDAKTVEGPASVHMGGRKALAKNLAVLEAVFANMESKSRIAKMAVEALAFVSTADPNGIAKKSVAAVQLTVSTDG